MFTSWIKQAPVNSLVTSIPETISVRQRLTVDRGQLVKNGVDVGATAVFNAGDSAVIQVYSSAAYGTPVFVTVTSDTGVKYIFTVISEDEVAFATDKRYVGSRAVDFLYFPDGTDFYPDDDNELVTETRTTNLFTLADGSTSTSSRLLVFLDFFNHRVLFIDPTTGALCSQINSELMETGLFSIARGDRFAFCTGSQIVVVNTSDWTIHTFLAEATVCSNDENFVYTANESIQRVRNFSGQIVSENPTGKRPTAIVGNYVAYFDGTVSDGLHSFKAPSAVRALAGNGTHLFAAYGDTLVKLDLACNVVATFQSENLFIVSIGCTGTSVVIGCFNNSVIVLDSALNVVETAAVDSPYGVAYFDQWYAASCYKGHPQAVYDIDTVPTAFDLSDKLDSRNHLSTSNAVVIDGISSEAVVTATTVGATLVINGVESGTTSAVRKGDTVAVRILSALAAAQKVFAPLVVGQQYAMYEVTTTAQDVLPDFFAFNTSTADVGSAVFSNTVTIAGIVEPITVSLSEGTLYVNSVPTAYPVLVNAGAKLAIRSVVSKTAKLVTMTAGSFRADYPVMPPVMDTTYYLDKAFYLLDEQAFGTTGQDSTNTLAMYDSTLTFEKRISFTAPKNSVIEKQPIALVVDVVNSKVYSVDANEFSHNKTLTLPKVVAADYAPKRPYAGGTTVVIVATKDTVYCYDRNFSLRWSKTMVFGDIVDVCFYNLTTLFIMRDQQVDVWTVDLGTGQMQRSDVIPFVGTHFAYYSTESYEEILLMCGHDGIQQFMGKTYDVVATTAVATDTCLYAFDRYSNELVLFVKGVEETRRKLAFPLGDMCILNGMLFAIDLKNNRLLKFDPGLNIVGETSINNTVDLMVWGQDIWLYEKLSLMADRTVLNALHLSLPESLNCAAGQPTEIKVIPTNFRPYDVVVSPSYGLALSNDGQPVTKVVGGKELTITALASDTALAKRRIYIVGSEANYWDFTTAPVTVPLPMTFYTIYDVLPSVLVESETNTVQGLSAGISATLKLDTEFGSIYVNGESKGLTATVVNGDSISLHIIPEIAFGSSATYKLYCGETEVGSQRVVARILGNAIKRPPIKPHFRITSTVITEHRASPAAEVLAATSAYSEPSAEYKVSTPTAHRNGLGYLSTGSVKAVNKNNTWLSSPRTDPNLVPSASISSTRSAVAEHVKLTAFSATSLRSAHVKENAYVANLSTAAINKHGMYSAALELPTAIVHHRLNVQTIVRPIPAYIKLGVYYEVLGKFIGLSYSNHALQTSVLKLTQFSLLTSSTARTGYQKRQVNTGWQVPQKWARYIFEPVDSTRPVPTAIVSKWYRIGLVFAKAVAESYEVKTSWFKKSSAFFFRPVRFSRPTFYDYAVNTWWEQTKSANAYSYVPSYTLSVPRVYKSGLLPLHAASGKSFKVAKLLQLESFSTLDAKVFSPSKFVGNLFTVDLKKSLALLKEALFEEPALIDAGVRGLFATADEALADSAVAKTPVTVVPFKSMYFWKQVPAIPSRECLTISGHGSRTAFKWNMQMATVLSSDKTSGFMGGG